jgi:DNA-binding GntR family transcriptional regulator
MARGSSLRERAEVAIRGGIITGEIQAGQIYSAPALGKQLGVSATPVREAMLDLANEGLVEAIPNRGFRVVPLLESDLDEITQLRVLLEVPPTVAIAGNDELLTEAMVKRLRAMADEIEKHAMAPDLPAFIDADRKFHLEILALHGNRRLVEHVERLRNATRRYGLRRLDRVALVNSAQRHHVILDALVEGDKERVQTLMDEHIRSNRGVLAGRADDIAPTASS